VGVTRQRVEQILSKLIRLNKVKRIETSGEAGQHVYMLADAKENEALLGRSPTLSSPCIRVLSAMKPDLIYRTVELVGPTPPTFVKHLEAFGLAYEFKVGTRSFCGLTPKGLLHPQYQSGGEKAQPADFVAWFGKVKAQYIQALRILGEAPTIELTFACGHGACEERAMAPAR